MPTATLCTPHTGRLRSTRLCSVGSDPSVLRLTRLAADMLCVHSCCICCVGLLLGGVRVFVVMSLFQVLYVLKLARCKSVSHIVWLLDLHGSASTLGGVVVVLQYVWLGCIFAHAQRCQPTVKHLISVCTVAGHRAEVFHSQAETTQVSAVSRWMHLPVRQWVGCRLDNSIPCGRCFLFTLALHVFAFTPLTPPPSLLHPPPPSYTTQNTNRRVWWSTWP